MLAGPSFPAKRMREPASFANGMYRPEIKPTHPRTSEASQQVTAQSCLYLVASVLISFPSADEYDTLK